MKLRWTRKARSDLLEIGKFIAQDNPAAARDWLSKLRDRARAVLDQPMSGRSVPECPNTGLREVLVGNYRIVYRHSEAEVLVITVFEGHRLLSLQDEDEADTVGT